MQKLRKVASEMTDYIRKAVDLADGWQTTRLGDQSIVVFVPHPEPKPKPHGELLRIGLLTDPHVKDALAAQLVRQVDANELFEVSIRRNFTSTVAYEDDFWVNKSISESPDRTMNTIHAIVDSKVLE